MTDRWFSLSTSHSDRRTSGSASRPPYLPTSCCSLWNALSPPRFGLNRGSSLFVFELVGGPDKSFPLVFQLIPCRRDRRCNGKGDWQVHLAAECNRMIEVGRRLRKA